MVVGQYSSMSFVIEDNIIKGEAIDFDFAALGGLGNILFRCMKKHGQNVAQIDLDSGKRNTYEHILRDAIRTAIVMKRKGIKKGDIVMGCSDNHLDAYTPLVAALFLAAIPCSMDPSLTPLEMTHIIKQAKPKMIFAIPASLEAVTKVCRQLNLNCEMVVFGASDEDTEFRSFIEKQTEEDEFEPVVSRDPKETAIIYFSSGTTGLAKACCLSHAYFIRQSSLVPSAVAPEDLDAERRMYEGSRFMRGGVFLNYSPAFWITGGKIFCENAFLGTTILYGRTFDTEQFWHTIEKYKVFCVLLSPFNIAQLTKCRKPPDTNTDILVKIITGGSPPRKRYCQLLQDIVPDTDINQSYGLTETGIVASFELFNKFHREYYRAHFDCVGFPMRGIWYKVVDLDTGEPLGPNQEGELLLKSDFFANGYHNQSASIFDEDGWFHTGDVAYYTDSGAFFVTDRLKELMKYRQLTVYPYVIENGLMEHPAVAQAAVVGVPHEEDGDRPAALVVLNENFGNVTADELREFVDGKMQDKARLRGGLRIVKGIPVTSMGKVKKREAKKMILEE